MIRQYVGARYVPKFANPVEWASNTSYEALTIVTFNNASYTSKVPVPPTVGNPANNPQYWALTGNYNAQVEQYRQETETVSNNLTTEITNRKYADTTLQGQITTEITNRENADTTLQGQITTEITNRKNADTTLQGQITTEITNREKADTTLQNQITKQQTEYENLTNHLTSIANSAISPTFVTSTSQMTDTSKVYVLTTDSHIYAYINGGMHDTGIVYNMDSAFVRRSTIVSGSYDLTDQDAFEVGSYYIGAGHYTGVPKGYETIAGVAACMYDRFSKGPISAILTFDRRAHKHAFVQLGSDWIDATNDEMFQRRTTIVSGSYDLTDQDAFEVGSYYIGAGHYTGFPKGYETLAGRCACMYDRFSKGPISAILTIDARDHKDTFVQFNDKWVTITGNTINNEFAQADIVWLGTSIPSGGLFGSENLNSYPYQIRQVLPSTTVLNNSVGSSSLTCKLKSLISDDNPYGYNTSISFEAASRILMATEEEKEWVINNYTKFSNAPSNLSDSDKNIIRATSYEKLVTPYLDKPRIWVINHGYNESEAENKEYDSSYPLEPYSMKGAYNMLINMILSAQPKSLILCFCDCTITNWTKISNAVVEDVANDWGLPCFEFYKYFMSNALKSITTKGGWVDGYWNENAYPNGHTMTLKEIAFPDGTHPHTDKSNKTNKQLGYIAGNWIKQQMFWFNI